jgi:hypothetical protein
MKPLSAYFAAAALAFCVIAGCEDSISSSPTASTSSSVTSEQSIPFDKSLELINPDLLIAHSASTGYTLSFEGYASGDANSPQMQALRSLRSVTFDVHEASGGIVASQTTEEIPTSGIRDQFSNGASLTATAGVNWAGPVSSGSYVVMTVRSDKGGLKIQKSFTDDVRN